MDKMIMSIEDTLRFVLLGMENGRIEPAIAILKQLLQEIETNPELAALRKK